MVVLKVVVQSPPGQVSVRDLGDTQAFADMLACLNFREFANEILELEYKSEC